MPVSYLLKLALAQAISDEGAAHPLLMKAGERFLAHFLNDNSSPETFSFYVIPLTPETGMGRAVAKEMAQRFLLTQLLVMYANVRFGLKDSGQRALIYFAPHPPIRQKELNSLISDSFYRELFMNPCLSGWDRGEDKFRYMHLCHQMLSRSQLNAVIKLRDAGIITRNLVVLPSTSNTSLANNGTHLSLGSRTLTRLLQDCSPAFTEQHEKYVGDLVIKIAEHFFPLFVGTYSAAPYRLDFWDFHPEKALGFLPHELEDTHLRMLWRRWKKKAGLSVFGHPITPLGPLWLDKATSAIFRLKGDFVPDFRLIDYLVALLSTSESPAHDGRLGNDQRLKRDLAQLGVFDESMSLYLLYKLRSYAAMGFSGFEGRQYSLFESLVDDMGDAASLQALVTALAFKYVVEGIIRHTDIPDDPLTESERRQMIFGTAIGIPTCNVRHNSPNSFLMKILSKTQKTRLSRRYADHLRVRLSDYQWALLVTLEEDGVDIIEQFGLREVINRLRERLLNSEHHGVAGKLTAGILREAGARSAMSLSGDEFNVAAESYYRETLRLRHLIEAFEVLENGVGQIDTAKSSTDEQYRRAMTTVLGPKSGTQFLQEAKEELIREDADSRTLQLCIYLTLLIICRDREIAVAAMAEAERDST